MTRDLDEHGALFLKQGETSQSLSLSDLFDITNGSVTPLLKAANPPVRANVLYMSTEYSCPISFLHYDSTWYNIDKRREEAAKRSILRITSKILPATKGLKSLFHDLFRILRSILRITSKENFDVDLSSKIVVDVIDFQMGRSFKNHRAKLQEHFLKCHGDEDAERAKGMKPTESNIKSDAWHILCDYRSSEKFQVMSRKNSENRGKRKYVALNGTISTPNHHLRSRASSDDPSIGEIETFRKLHYREKEGWVNDYARTSYENMVEIKQHTGSTENPPDDLEIMQQVLGKRSTCIRGWSRVPSTRSDSTNSRYSTGSSSRLSHTEMSTRLTSTESELALTKSELASTKSELTSTKSELSLMKNDMADLRRMVMSIVPGQPPSTFSASLNDNGSETRAR